MVWGGCMEKVKNLGCKVKVCWYNGSPEPEVKEAFLFSMKQFAKLMLAIKLIGKPYGVSYKNDEIVIHVFLDR